MKTHHRLRHSVLSHLALVAGLGLLTCAPPPAAPKWEEPVYSDVPGLTSPLPPQVVPTNPPPAPVIVQPQITPPPALVEEETKNKTLYGFQATDLDLRAALATFAKA